MAKKILLADDSLTIQKVVELTFSDSDYELVCVSNGQKALDRVREDRPDLILADVVMPEKNGYEVCETIKGDPATARIPVVLLSGTFEPFDRARAERIGADAIVPKPFDSQQLLAQVEALIAKAPPRPVEPPAKPPELPQTTAAIAIPAAPVAAPSSSTYSTAYSSRPAQSAPPAAAHEEAPFDVGFSAEDFTAAVRLPSPRAGMDPFEEEYGRGDVDSAIEAFEKAHPRFGFGSELDTATPLADAPLQRDDSAPGREAQWLRDEPEKAPAIGFPAERASTIKTSTNDAAMDKPAPAPAPVSDDPAATTPFPTATEEPAAPLDFGSVSPDAATVALRRAEFPTLPSDEMPTMEYPVFGRDRRPEVGTEDMGADAPRPWLDTAPQPAAVPLSPPMEISAQDADALFDVSGGGDAPGADDGEGEGSEADFAARAPETSPEPSAATAGSSQSLSGEIEMLAQRSSIPELTQMLSSVRASGDGAGDGASGNGMGEMTDEQLDRLASKVVEKLSDRIVREIAWEVIPDMAEIVIKQRIKELESNAE